MHEHASIFTALGHGIPLATILQWIAKYGLPLLLKVLPVVLGSGTANLTVAQLIAMIEAALTGAASSASAA